MLNKGLAKKETCGWQNTDLTTLTRWQTDTGAKFTLTATGYGHDRFTNNVMLEFSGNITGKIKYEGLGRTV